MSAAEDPRERARELLLEDLLVGLAPAEREELLRLAEPAEREELERAVASLSLAGLGALEAPPAALQERLEAAAHAQAAARAPARSPERAAPARPRLALLAGWLVAAAAVLALVVQQLPGRAPDFAARRQSLLAHADDLVRAEWVASEDPLAAGVSGDIVWSGARQEGYMRFRSLPANDPAQAQYQLWIFDPTRDDWEAQPVDGGVFDVRPGVDVVVPIEAKLAVRETGLFAVTLEAPGGVVVSRREHLLLTATP